MNLSSSTGHRTVAMATHSDHGFKKMAVSVKEIIVNVLLIGQM